ncbi:hypothetical protein NC651_034568 [Populus alba x Populus x berolinensis]|nr:hypothetical protein NC651_034568 [Populus alba x Populus x berolinensis]
MALSAYGFEAAELQAVVVPRGMEFGASLQRSEMDFSLLGFRHILPLRTNCDRFLNNTFVEVVSPALGTNWRSAQYSVCVCPEGPDRYQKAQKHLSKLCCREWFAHRVDALLLTDSNTLLCGILTDKDLVSRVIARELNLEETPVSKVMTRNPVFVLSETLAVEALQKMVQGKFRHLPVVENGEVIALLDIAKCLYDAIARMERAAEKGKAIAAAVEGVEKNWGTSISGTNTFIETLRERIFRPAISTIIPENSKIVTVSPTETVLEVTKKMLESSSSCAV